MQFAAGPRDQDPAPPAAATPPREASGQQVRVPPSGWGLGPRPSAVWRWRRRVRAGDVGPEPRPAVRRAWGCSRSIVRPRRARRPRRRRRDAGARGVAASWSMSAGRPPDPPGAAAAEASVPQSRLPRGAALESAPEPRKVAIRRFAGAGPRLVRPLATSEPGADGTALGPTRTASSSRSRRPTRRPWPPPAASAPHRRRTSRGPSTNGDTRGADHPLCWWQILFHLSSYSSPVCFSCCVL